jgi:isochorismate hydrolase
MVRSKGEQNIGRYGNKELNKYSLNQENAVLLIIDIQEKLVLAVNRSEEVIKNSYILLTTAQKLGIPVIATEQYPKGLGKTVPALSKYLDPQSIYEKVSFSACLPGVLSALKSLGRKKVIIAGMETHVCVYQTVRDLLENDFEVFLAADAVNSRTESNYQSGLAMMASMGAIISNTETIFFDLLKKAGTPVFKELSRLIK